MSRRKMDVLGQVDIGRWWGNLKLIAQHSNLYIQVLILGFSGIGAYTTIHTWFLGKGIDLPFWAFAVMTSVTITAMCLFEWKVGLPSVFSSWNKQSWEHNNPVRELLEGMEKRINERLDKIKDKS